MAAWAFLLSLPYVKLMIFTRSQSSFSSKDAKRKFEVSVGRMINFFFCMPKLQVGLNSYNYYA